MKLYTALMESTQFRSLDMSLSTTALQIDALPTYVIWIPVLPEVFKDGGSKLLFFLV
jgi:hypothetical protein